MFSKDVEDLVVQPIEKMLEKVKNYYFAKTNLFVAIYKNLIKLKK